MIQAFLGLLLPVAAIWAVFRAANLGLAAHSRLLTVALASCVGIGASSAVTFTTLMLGGTLNASFVARDAAMWLVVLAVALWKARGRILDAGAPFRPPTTIDWILRGAFVATLILAVAVVVSEYAVAPHGQWDAWAIWNQKARFMLRAGPRWTDSVLIPWSQPSHPPLVAASVARLWAYAGQELTAVPAMLSAAFAVSTLAVLMGALDLRRRRAYVAGIVLLAPLPFAHLASAQTADLPISLFLIATLVMLPMRPAGWRAGFETSASLWLAGATASLAAWTKNEGVVFLAASSALVAWSAFRYGRVRDIGWWMCGAAPFLLALAWFKIAVVPEAPEYLEGATDPSTMLARVFDAGRQSVLWQTVGSMALRWGGPAAAGSLLVVTGVAVSMALRPQGNIARGFLGVAGVMVSGYCAVYLLTPLDVGWLILTTFDRLTLQLWPILVFAACAPVDDPRGVME